MPTYTVGSFFDSDVLALVSTAPAPRPQARSIVYIDGFNFYYGAVKGTCHKWLDIERYFTRLRQDDDLQRIHYFTALVSGPGQADQETYLQA